MRRVPAKTEPQTGTYGQGCGGGPLNFMYEPKARSGRSRENQVEPKTDILIYGRAVRQINNATFLICLPRLWRSSFYVNGDFVAGTAFNPQLGVLCINNEKNRNNLQWKCWWCGFPKLIMMMMGRWTKSSQPVWLPALVFFFLFSASGLIWPRGSPLWPRMLMSRLKESDPVIRFHQCHPEVSPFSRQSQNLLHTSWRSTVCFWRLPSNYMQFLLLFYWNPHRSGPECGMWLPGARPSLSVLSAQPTSFFFLVRPANYRTLIHLLFTRDPSRIRNGVTLAPPQ